MVVYLGPEFQPQLSKNRSRAKLLKESAIHADDLLGVRRGVVATIKASCSNCGDVTLTSRDITVRVCSADYNGSYHFTCPRCDQIETRTADPRVVELLVTSGVRLVTWHLPEELHESHSGEPIAYEDLLAFNEILKGDDWIDTLGSLDAG